MNARDKFYFKLSLNIAIVFIVVISLSYVPDKYPKLFGDYLCEGRKWINGYHVEKDYVASYHLGCDVGLAESYHNPEWHWGYQHWLWFIMGLCLFIVQFFRISEIINKKDK